MTSATLLVGLPRLRSGVAPLALWAADGPSVSGRPYALLWMGCFAGPGLFPFPGAKRSQGENWGDPTPKAAQRPQGEGRNLREAKDVRDARPRVPRSTAVSVWSDRALPFGFRPGPTRAFRAVGVVRGLSRDTGTEVEIP